MTWRTLVLCSIAIVAACKSKETRALVEAAPAPVVATPDASPRATKRPSPRDIVEAWNDAHVKHDTRTLENLYASSVTFYGQTLSSRECVARKDAAFKKDPGYTQSIRDVVATTTDAGASPLTVIHFTKTSVSAGKSTDYPSTLVLNGAGLIASETDAVTDSNLAKMAAAAAEWCTNNDPHIFDAMPNNKVIAPYKLSSIDVWRRAQLTKFYGDLVASHNGDFLLIDIIECPTGCDRASRQCGYTMRIGNHSNLGDHFPWAVAWIYVDAVDGTVWYETNSVWKSEPLPPLDESKLYVNYNP